MSRLAVILTLLSFTATSAHAQGFVPDARIVELPAEQTGLFYLAVPAEATQVFLVRSSERIQSVVLSDPTSFDVQRSGAGDSMTIRATRSGGASIMTVQTDRRVYELQLTHQGVGFAPTIVRVVDQSPSPRTTTTTRVSIPNVDLQDQTYIISGSKALRPTSLRDDGTKTYIEWAADQALPATFAIGPAGDEQMVDGYIRAGVFTIDRVYSQLIFRIDNDSAKAKRTIKRTGDG
jgi:type IV secretion system protein VirB9